MKQDSIKTHLQNRVNTPFLTKGIALLAVTLQAHMCGHSVHGMKNVKDEIKRLFRRNKEKRSVSADTIHTDTNSCISSPQPFSQPTETPYHKSISSIDSGVEIGEYNTSAGVTNDTPHALYRAEDFNRFSNLHLHNAFLHLDLNEENASLKSEITYLRSILSSLYEENAFLKSEITYSRNTLSSLYEENAFLKSEITYSRNVPSYLYEENAFLKSEITYLRNALSYLPNKENDTSPSSASPSILSPPMTPFMPYTTTYAQSEMDTYCSSSSNENKSTEGCSASSHETSHRTPYDIEPDIFKLYPPEESFNELQSSLPNIPKHNKSLSHRRKVARATTLPTIPEKSLYRTYVKRRALD